MEFRQNDQLRLATEFVQFTDRNIFLTGKAGTGKTTFLHNLRKITPKRLVVVAPTGVAAINAGGVTIHSFFQLSFAPAIPEAFRGLASGQKPEGFQQKFHREKINLIKCLDLLVIDEISMVRADVLDSVDEVLRRYRNHSKPFGGVQLLMIGDLHQLSPVIKDNEWSLLRDYYKSVYFFDSLALQKSNPITIELVENFRQSDAVFISLLNKVRENEMDRQVINELNARFIPGFKPNENDGYITLTTHNALAADINNFRLKEINRKSHFFKAEISDDFPAYLFPTDEKLELKVGAQVMFIKNDLSQEKSFYNGKIGKITRIDDQAIFVKCPSGGDEIEVPKMKWENVKYSVNQETKEIKEDISGVFTQYPLRLAWAITIHKSQGLTFDKVIIDANAAFAFGQVYVALSRCRTFEGIVLSTPISMAGIKTDALIVKYSYEAQQQKPGPEKLAASKHQFQEGLIGELFDFKPAKYRFDSLLRLVKENAHSLDNTLIRDLQDKRQLFETDIFQIGEKFKIQLSRLMAGDVLPEENEELQTRIGQAIAWFTVKVTAHLTSFLEKLTVETDNKAVKKTMIESLEKLERESFIRLSCLKGCQNGFQTIAYLKTRSTADIDFRASSKQKAATQKQSYGNILHAELYYKLRDWRDNLADDQNLPTYMILPQKSMQELLKKLPMTIPALKEIKGIGQAKINQFGNEIISMIRDYCFNNKIAPVQAEIPIREKKEKTPSATISFNMFKSGKTMEEIAAERMVTLSTVEIHLAPFIGTGDLPVTKFVPHDQVQKIAGVFHDHPEKSLGEIKNIMGDAVTYPELRFVLQHLKSQILDRNNPNDH